MTTNWNILTFSHQKWRNRDDRDSHLFCLSFDLCYILALFLLENINHEIWEIFAFHSNCKTGIQTSQAESREASQCRKQYKNTRTDLGLIFTCGGRSWTLNQPVKRSYKKEKLREWRMWEWWSGEQREWRRSGWWCNMNTATCDSVHVSSLQSTQRTRQPRWRPSESTDGFSEHVHMFSTAGPCTPTLKSHLLPRPPGKDDHGRHTQRSTLRRCPS